MVSIKELAGMVPVNPPELKLNRDPIIKNIGVIDKKQLDHREATRFNILIPVGIAVIEVAGVK